MQLFTRENVQKFINASLVYPGNNFSVFEFSLLQQLARETYDNVTNNSSLPCEEYIPFALPFTLSVPQVTHKYDQKHIWQVQVVLRYEYEGESHAKTKSFEWNTDPSKQEYFSWRRAVIEMAQSIGHPIHSHSLVTVFSSDNDVRVLKWHEAKDTLAKAVTTSAKFKVPRPILDTIFNKIGVWFVPTTKER